MLNEDEITKRRRIMDAMLQGLKRPQGDDRYPNGVRREPFDERLPSGESAMDVGLPKNVRDMLTRATIQGQGLPRHGSMEVRTGELEGLAPPAAPSTPPVTVPPMGAVEPPTASVPPFNPQDVPAPRIGYGSKGLTGVDRLIERRKSLEEAAPTSQVTEEGEILPPTQRKGFMGHLKSAGEAGLAAFGSGDPDRPLYSLGQGLGGLATGAVSPRSGAKITRRFEMNRLDNDIARGLKLEQEQAELGSMEALRRNRELEPAIQMEKLEFEREIQNKKLEIEQRKAAGLISKAEADRQQRELDRRSREKIAADRITSAEKIAGMRPNGDDARARKAAAAQAEYEQLVSDEQKAGDEKNRAYDYLAKLKKDPNLTKEDIAEATRAAEEANKIYQSFAEKKRDAQTRIRENSVSPPSQASRYSGRTMSQANLARYAKDKGISVEEARAQVEAQGVKVQ